MECISGEDEVVFSLITCKEELEYDSDGTLNFFCKNIKCK